jgi:uncharacterized protein (UPF0332 family)
VTTALDAAIAALSWVGADLDNGPPETHSGLFTRFGQNLVLANLLSSEPGRALNRVQELRLMADYLAEPVSLDKAQWAIQEPDRFVAAVSGLLLQSKPPSN